MRELTPEFKMGGAVFAILLFVLSIIVLNQTTSNDHGILVGLDDDDHSQYALLDGRPGGQILTGGTDTGDDLTLRTGGGATGDLIFFGFDCSGFTNDGAITATSLGQATCSDDNAGGGGAGTPLGATLTDDNIWLGDATNFSVEEPIPDCDSLRTALQYDATTNNLTCGSGVRFLNDLTDVIITTSALDLHQTIIWDGATWTNDFAERTFLTARNESGSVMTIGQFVFISGYNIGLDLPLIDLADADNAAAMPSIAMIHDATIANNASGLVQILGRRGTVDTSACSAGDMMFVSTTTGDFDCSAPTGATTQVQTLGTILRSHATLGVVELNIHQPLGFANILDDSTIVGNSSDVATATALPNCSGATNALRYTTATNLFSCGTIVGGGGGGTISVDEDGIEVLAVLGEIDFRLGFDISTSTPDIASVSLDLAEVLTTGIFDRIVGTAGDTATADNLTDILTFLSSNGTVSITGSAAGDSLDFSILAFATNPTDCTGIQLASAIDDQGNLTCISITDAHVPDTITINLAATATRFAADPSDCTGIQIASAIDDQGNLTCITLTDAHIPNNITIDLATNATNLAADPTDCAGGTFADAIDAQGDLTCNSVDISADTNLVAGRSLTLTGDSIAADNELFEHACTWSYLDIATDTADSGFSNNTAGCSPDIGVSLTVERFFCITSIGSASVTTDEVTRANTYSTGTPIADFVPFNCTTGGNTITSFTNATIAAGSLLQVRTGTTTSDAGIDITIIVDMDKDD